MRSQHGRKELCLSISGFNEAVVHTCKQAYITGPMKSEVISLLERNTAFVTRTNLVNEMKRHGDGTCPLIPSEQNVFFVFITIKVNDQQYFYLIEYGRKV